MNLVGTVATPVGIRPVEIRAGENNGFFTGLEASTGQIREPAGPTPDGEINQPIAVSDSFFDVFFDIWVDINDDSMVDVGEVVRNFDDALRMENIQPLPTLPPPLGTDYESIGKVDANDPNLGTFAATVILNEVLDLKVVFLDGFAGEIHAQLDPEGGHTHSIIPLPAALPLFGTGSGILGFLGWRRRRQAQAV